MTAACRPFRWGSCSRHIRGLAVVMVLLFCHCALTEHGAAANAEAMPLNGKLIADTRTGRDLHPGAGWLKPALLARTKSRAKRGYGKLSGGTRLMARSVARPRGVVQRPGGRDAVPWAPSKTHPLRVHHILNFTTSGAGGLNNVLWAVSHALRNGCHEALRNTRASGAGGAPSFAAVILPPIRATLDYGPAKDAHSYSDLFDLERQALLQRQSLGCFVTDQTTFDRQVQVGAVILSADVRVSAKQGIDTKRSGMDRLYAGLEMSASLRKRLYEPCMAKMWTRFGSGGPSPYLAVHMRVEDDWIDYCSRREKSRGAGSKGGREAQGSKVPLGRACFGADEVANITLGTPELRGYSNILVLYAADNFNQPGNRRPGNLNADPLKVWPDGVKATSPFDLGCFSEGGSAASTYTERSVVSFFMASDADVFVGTHWSTFTRGVRSHRHMARPSGKGTYIYDSWSTGYTVAKKATATHLGDRRFPVRTSNQGPPTN